MAENCNDRVEFRKYKRMGAVSVSSAIKRKPKGAPSPRKSLSKIEKELTFEIDTQVYARNMRPRPDCKECDQFAVLLGEKIARREVKWIWSEKYRLTDPKGNVIEGTAKYMATGRVNIRIRFWDYICDEAFGSDASEFNADDPNILNDRPYSEEEIKKALENLKKADDALWKYSKVKPFEPSKNDKKKKRKKKKSKKGK